MSKKTGSAPSAVRMAALAAMVALAVSLSGCASMLKAMGGVSKAELTAATQASEQKLAELESRLLQSESDQRANLQDALARLGTALNEIEAIKADLARMTAEIEKANLTAQELERAKATMESLTARVDQLSDQTLMKLAGIIQGALGANAKLPVSSGPVSTVTKQTPAPAQVAAPAATPAPAQTQSAAETQPAQETQPADQTATPVIQGFDQATQIENP